MVESGICAEGTYTHTSSRILYIIDICIYVYVFLLKCLCREKVQKKVFASFGLTAVAIAVIQAPFTATTHAYLHTCTFVCLYIYIPICTAFLFVAFFRVRSQLIDRILSKLQVTCMSTFCYAPVRS